MMFWLGLIIGVLIGIVIGMYCLQLALSKI